MNSTSASLAEQHPIVASLAKAIRYRRLLRGCLMLSIAAFGVLGIVFLIHTTVGLSPSAMRWSLVLWATACCVAMLIGLVVPWWKRISPEALAARIEQVYPNLAERLSTTASCASETSHGARSLTRLIHEQIEHETNKIDIRTIVDGRRLTPWYCAASVLFLAFVVGLCSASFRQFTGAFFCLTDIAPNHSSSQSPAPEYRIELRQAHAIIAPPAYVQPLIHGPQKSTLPAPHTALEFGNVQYELNTDQPFAAGRIYFEREDGKRHTVTFQSRDDFKKQSAEIPQLTSGSYRVFVSFQNRKGVWSRRATLGTLSMESDEKPVITPANRFGKVIGATGVDESATLPAVSPDEYLPIAVDVHDREGVEQVELHFSVNDGPEQTVVIAVGDGHPTVSRFLHWPLKGVAKVGDVVRYRIKAYDNRRVPAESHTDILGRSIPPSNLIPHVVFDPPVKIENQWYALRVQAGADSMERQHVIAQNEWLTKQLTAIREALRKEQLRVQKTHNDARDGQIDSRTKTKLSEIQRTHEKNLNNLLNLAKGMEQTWPLEKIGKEARNIAEKELEPSDDLLKSIPSEKVDSNRKKQFAKIDSHLSQAQQRLSDLQRLTDQLTKSQLEQMDLDDLAAKEKQLAEKAGALTDANPSDEKTKKQIAKLQENQKEVRDKLEAMADKSGLVKKALDSLRGKHLQQFALKADQLAVKQQAMNAQNQSSAKMNASKLDQIIREQKSIVSDSVAKKETSDDGKVTIEAGKAAVKDLQATKLQQAMANQLQFGQILESWAKRIAPVSIPALQTTDVAALAKQQSQVLLDLKTFAKEFVKYPPLEFDKKIAALKARQSKVKRHLDAMWAKLVQAGPKPLMEKARTGVMHATLLMDRNKFYQATAHMRIGIDALREAAKTSPSPIDEPLAKDAAPNEKLAFSVRQLAKRQFDLRDEVAKLLRMMRQHSNAAAEQIKGQEAQRSQTAKLKQGLQEMAKQTHDADFKKELAQAAKMAEAAETEMKKIEQGLRSKDEANAKKAGQDAVELLKKTGDLAKKTASKMMAGTNPKADEAGMAFKLSQNQLKEAEKQLAKGKMRQAQSAMQNAAKSLKRVAQKSLPRPAKMSKGGPPNQAGKTPNPKFGKNFGPLSTGKNPPLQTGDHAKKWGELAGKLPTDMVQVMRARYGDDYAQIIQRYFQQIADIPITDRQTDK